MKNLWQNLEEITSDKKNPIAIIREQSDYLYEGTNRMLCIEDSEFNNMSVYTKTVFMEHNLPNRFKYKIEICSEYLRDYSFTLFYMYYDIEFYPVVINLPIDIGREIFKEGFSCIESSDTRMFFTVNSQEQFEELLGIIFNCEKVRTIMKNMKAIIEDENEEIIGDQ